ncbi:MAG: hypothetical protein HUN04_12570 [Desulfobacter sp.]|nr:MAG: hypothetical protein HUN04_12570 [Desulfobacter sp.]
MKKLSIFSVSLLLIFLFTGCVSKQAKPQKSQLQIRSFQTKTFQTTDIKLAMKAMLNVLQDDGFIVKNAVLDLGLLSAEKTIDVEDKTEAAWATFWLGPNAVYKKASIIECTANVSELIDTVKVRANFQLKMFNNKGGIIKVEQIDDEKYYKDFFMKVDKGMFLQKEKI